MVIAQPTKKNIQTNNKRGKKSLLSIGIDPFNKYLLQVCTGPGCVLLDGLAERLRAHWYRLVH